LRAMNWFSGKKDKPSAQFHAQAGELASAFPPLYLEAERIAQTVMMGRHGVRRSGQGNEFWQFQNYHAGSDAARIDWRQSAKRGELYIREREDERTQTVCIWLDVSPSMMFQSSAELPLKLHRGIILSLALAMIVERSGDHVFFLAEGYVARSVEQMVEVVAALIGKPGEDRSALPEITAIPQGTKAILLGDFFAEFDELEQQISDIKARGCTAVMAQIMDPVEQNWDFQGRIYLEGLEGEAPVLIDHAGMSRAEYDQEVQKFQQALRETAHIQGWYFFSHCTDQSPYGLMEYTLRCLSDGQSARVSEGWKL